MERLEKEKQRGCIKCEEIFEEEKSNEQRPGGETNAGPACRMPAVWCGRSVRTSRAAGEVRPEKEAGKASERQRRTNAWEKQVGLSDRMVYRSQGDQTGWLDMTLLI